MATQLGDYLFENSSCVRHIFCGEERDGRKSKPYYYEILGYTSNPSRGGRVMKIDILDENWKRTGREVFELPKHHIYDGEQTQPSRTEHPKTLLEMEEERKEHERRNTFKSGGDPPHPKKSYLIQTERPKTP